MEEVWKDISLSSSYPSTTTKSTNQNHHANFHSNFILQDFLSPQNNQDPLTDEYSFANNTSTTTTTPFSGLPPPPATYLSLKSGQLDTESSTPLSSFNYAFEGLVFSGPLCSKKRVSEENDGSGDRRHKRMMKNRESAARSRARKQAYTFQLEKEKAYLMEENASLRRKLGEKSCFVAAVEIPKKANSV